MAEYVVLAPATSHFPIVLSLYTLYVRPILVSPDYGVVWAHEDVAVLRRGAAHEPGLALLRSSAARCPVLARIADGSLLPWRRASRGPAGAPLRPIDTPDPAGYTPHT
jgi:hypothetical protein